MNSHMQPTLPLNIDVCLVKYITRDQEEVMWNNLISQLQQPVEGININILIHDNNSDNIGLLKARNRLLLQSNIQSTIRYVCFMDFDIHIKSIDWSGIIQKLQSDPKIAIISPVTQRFSTVDVRTRWQEKKYIACNFMVFNRGVFNNVGAFDEDFFVAYGDWDMVKRCMDKGYKIIQDNHSVIQHFGTSRFNPKKSQIWAKDFAVYIKKHKIPLNRGLK